MLSAEAVSAQLGGRTVVADVSATFEGGALVGVIGPNGAGKSTLARALLGLIRPSQGRVLLDGQDIATIPPRDLALRVAYLAQGQSLHWPLSVERLVALGRLPHLGPFSRIGQADAAAIEDALRDTGTLALRARIATELSGGERARAMLARALAVGAGVLIVDEPLASLDPGHQLEVMALLAARARAGTLVLVILHDLAIAARFCDRLLLLDHGRLVADGGADTVLSDDALARVYGITAYRGASGAERLIVPLHRTAPQHGG